MKRAAIPLMLIVSLSCRPRIPLVIEPGGAASDVAFAKLVKPDVGAELVPADLQGTALTWQGYRAWLRFSTKDDIVALLLKAGYRECEWSEVEYHFDPPEESVGTFTPPWDPSAMKTRRCFVAKVVNDWTHAGEHRFVIDAESGVVCFSGTGG